MVVTGAVAIGLAILASVESASIRDLSSAEAGIVFATPVCLVITILLAGTTMRCSDTFLDILMDTCDQFQLYAPLMLPVYQLQKAADCWSSKLRIQKRSLASGEI